MYQAIFSHKAEKSLKKIPKEFQRKIKEGILKLEENPFCFGTIKLVDYPVAQYRHRVGDYRILFDIWEEKKILMILDIKRRTSTSY
jgi:mRNA interferase RelE/StbE